MEQNKCTQTYTQKGTWERWVYFWRHIAKTQRWGPSYEWECVWWKLHQCEWMVFLFQIYLIVYLSSLFNSTSYKVLTVRIQVLISRVMSFTWTGFELTEYNVLGHCTGRGLNHKWDGENERKDWTVSADFFFSLHVFTLKHQIKQKVLTTCVAYVLLSFWPTRISHGNSPKWKKAKYIFQKKNDTICV